MIEVYKVDNFEWFIFVYARNIHTFTEYRMLMYNNGYTIYTCPFKHLDISEQTKDDIFKAYLCYMNKNTFCNIKSNKKLSGFLFDINLLRR